MQIVIDIPDRIYYGAKNSITVNGSDASQMLIDAVKNGTPLPKGHGRLIDVREAYRKFYSRCLAGVAKEVLDETATIIEADKAECEE